MTKLHELNELGQSIWYDNIRRALLDSGDLQALVDTGVTGITSNPSIFEKAITGSDDYDDDLEILVRDGKSAEEIFEALALDDIRRAADLLRSIYDATGGTDGYVSLEVSPELAHDTDGTIAAARRLFGALDRPNVMIKVPATQAGIPAIETLIGEGININVTLMFSLDHYDAVAEAYLSGLARLAAGGGDLTRVASVASFFVSRVDVAVDAALEEAGNSNLKGKIAIANAKLAYARFQETFSGERWQELAALGARVQRPLWASTSTKDPAYPDTLYMDALIGPDTVNTVPPATLNAFRDHGTVSLTLEADMGEAREQLARLGEMGIDLSVITEDLQDAGVRAFADAYQGLLESIREKCAQLTGLQPQNAAELGGYQSVVDQALDEVESEDIIARIWAHDHTVWAMEPTEIANRLGWLHSAEVMGEHIGQLAQFVEGVKQDGYTDVLLMGMGGSSLAPEVFSSVFGTSAPGELRLDVLDSTDPDAIQTHADRLDPARTLFIVATKSGGTTETLSFFKYFYNRTVDAIGTERAGEHFVAITDPGSKLEDLAASYGFRITFRNDPNIGGRYSALSYFGLVPAALLGVDVKTLLDRAVTAAGYCRSCTPPGPGVVTGAWLGAVLGELAAAGRDKATFVLSPAIASFGDWVEQLIAESTGKQGTGIFPVVGEPVGDPDVYGDDRLFIYLQLDGDDTYDGAVQALQDAGQPVVRLRLDDTYDLGEQFFLWEMAIAVAGYRLGINPFDQPNVEAAKVLARSMVAEYQEKGRLPANQAASLTSEALARFLDQAETGDYITLQAYVQPTPETDRALLSLRTRLRDRLKLATSVGYGPRFLHSTGQLHKGDGGNGLFIQFTSDATQDIPIPDEAGTTSSSITFGVLKAAQALGDRRALEDAERRVIHFDLGQNVVTGLQRLTEGLA
ncbi:MAG: bifunctional transaldolase/phosoglucose isomerase [Anaerolineae bacterium]